MRPRRGAIGLFVRRNSAAAVARVWRSVIEEDDKPESRGESCQRAVRQKYFLEVAAQRGSVLPGIDILNTGESAAAFPADAPPPYLSTKVFYSGPLSLDQ